MSIFPTRILLATDGSREAQLAASTAADLANTTNSELHLITVAPGNPDPVYHIHEGSFRYETYQQALEAIKGEAQRVLDEQVQKVEEAGGSVKEAYLRVGERRDQAIVHLAEELGAGLIVMGSRGKTGTDGKRLRLRRSPRSLPCDGRAPGEGTGRVRSRASLKDSGASCSHVTEPPGREGAIREGRLLGSLTGPLARP